MVKSTLIKLHIKTLIEFKRIDIHPIINDLVIRSSFEHFLVLLFFCLVTRSQVFIMSDQWRMSLHIATIENCMLYCKTLIIRLTLFSRGHHPEYIHDTFFFAICHMLFMNFT